MDGIDQLLGLWTSLKKKYPEAARELLPEFKEAMKELQAGSQVRSQARPQESSEEEVHVITVIGRASDGRQYMAEFDAVFPPGTKIESVSERQAPNNPTLDL